MRCIPVVGVRGSEVGFSPLPGRCRARIGGRGGDGGGRRRACPREDGGGYVRWARAGTGGTRKGRSAKKKSFVAMIFPDFVDARAAVRPSYPYPCFFFSFSFLFLLP
jgi:hypothetical protein